MSKTNQNHLRPEIQRLSQIGWNASEIAEQLKISIDTVRYHQKKDMPYSARRLEAKITVSDVGMLRQEMKEGDEISCYVQEIDKSNENLPTVERRRKFYILRKLRNGVLIGQRNQRKSYHMITYVDILLTPNCYQRRAVAAGI